MLAFIYDCTPIQRENGIHKNDCMMGIPTGTTRNKGGEMESLSPATLISSHSSSSNEVLLEQKQQQTPVLLRQKYWVCSCWLHLIKALSCQGQGQGCSGVSPAQHCSHSSCYDYGCSLHVWRAYKEEDKLLWGFDNSPAAAVDLCSVYDITIKTKGKWIQQ